MEDIKEFKERALWLIKEYYKEAYPCVQILEPYHWIVTCGAYTVGADDKTNIVELENKYFPTLWTEERAMELVQSLKAIDGEGKPAKVEMIRKKKWYQDRINEYIEILDIMKKNENQGAV